MISFERCRLGVTAALVDCDGCWKMRGEMVQDYLDLVPTAQGRIGKGAALAKLLAVAGVEVAAPVRELSPITEIIPHVGTGFGVVEPGLCKELLKRR